MFIFLFPPSPSLPAYPSLHLFSSAPSPSLSLHLPLSLSPSPSPPLPLSPLSSPPLPLYLQLVYITGHCKVHTSETYVACTVHIVSAPSILEIRAEGNAFSTRHNMEMKIIFYDERCVCVCACVCVRARVCVCMCACVYVCVCV